MVDILKGKALEDFEKWYIKFIGLKYLSYKEYYINRFLDKHPSEQYGVLEDWFDSVEDKTEVRILPKISRGWKCYFTEIKGITDKHNTRNEARMEAIKKAVETYNKLA